MSARPLTYPEVGGTAGELPAGYRHLLMGRHLGNGRDVFEAAADRLLTWRMHEDSGLRVSASSADVQADALVVLGFSWGPLRLTAPCRVVYVVAEDDRRGFAYGTLPGHPERGEECFSVGLAPDGTVTARITSFSRPASWAARIGGPVARRVQIGATEAYLDALT